MNKFKLFIVLVVSVLGFNAYAIDASDASGISYSRPETADCSSLHGKESQGEGAGHNDDGDGEAKMYDELKKELLRCKKTVQHKDAIKEVARLRAILGGIRSRSVIARIRMRNMSPSQEQGAQTIMDILDIPE